MAWGKVFEALPPDLTREQVLFFDAVDLLIPACQVQYARIRESAAAYTGTHHALNDAEEAAQSELRETLSALQAILMADAGAFVATIQRLRRVAVRLRGDSEIRVAKQAFEASIKDYEEARHYLEHLDTAIPKIVATGHGALGAMAWHYAQQKTNQFGAIMLIPGHPAKGTSQVAIRMEASVRPPVDHVWSTIGGADYYLTGAAEAVDRLSERLRDWSTRWDPGTRGGVSPP